jgi:oxysterol-binding protein-related protein 9/10/11
VLSFPYNGETETYLITLPGLHIEGLIFGAPFVELDGTSFIVSSTGYTAKIDYSGRGWLSGKKNTIAASVYPTGKEKEVLYNVTGQWNIALELYEGPVKKNSSSTRKDTYDAVSTEETELKLAPIEDQHPLESRRAWSRVADAITKGDMENTSVEKGKIEQAQRDKRAAEREEGTSWERRYFTAVEEGEDETLNALGQAAGVPANGDADKTGGLWRFDPEKAKKAEAEKLTDEEKRKIEEELLGW